MAPRPPIRPLLKRRPKMPPGQLSMDGLEPPPPPRAGPYDAAPNGTPVPGYVIEGAPRPEDGGPDGR